MIEEKTQQQMLHATAVAVDGHGILLTGPSGIGKSDLAIRLIDRGAMLVSDDQVKLELSGNRVLSNAPPSISGKIEIRELGIFELDYVEKIPLKLVVELSAQNDRFPMENQTRSFMNVQMPCVKIDAELPSAPIKVEMMLQRLLLLENQK